LRGHTSQKGTYFDTELVSDTWVKAGIEVTQQFWRRPLSAVVAEFSAAGFVIDGLTEARPSAEAITRFPDDLAQIANIPTFIVYRLKLSPSK
jgi:hypothetical protein